MTAEVAILNRGAVAIAADSAVTLGAPGRKIYNTANKLFPLSATEPVAVMIYGSGSFGPIPWETVVKEHRQRLGSRTFDTVAEYADEFLEFLSTLVTHIPVAQQQNLVWNTAVVELESLREATFNLLRAARRNGVTPDENAVLSLLMTLAEQREQELAADAAHSRRPPAERAPPRAPLGSKGLVRGPPTKTARCCIWCVSG